MGNLYLIISVTVLQTDLIFVANSVQEGLIDLDLLSIFKKRELKLLSVGEGGEG
jgi:hypothetical protein